MISLTPMAFVLRQLAWFSPGAAGAAGASPNAGASPDLPLVVLVGTEATARKLGDRLREGNAPCRADVREEAVIRMSAASDSSGLDSALRHLQSEDDRWPDWLILLSRPACQFVVERADQLGIDRTCLARPKLAVVGKATAEAARGYGLQPTLVAPGATAANLVEQLRHRDDVQDASLLVPRSAIGEDDVARSLLGIVREVSIVTAYDNCPAPIDEARWSGIAHAPSSPVIAFLSSSSVTALWSGLPVDLQTRLAERARFVAMGPSTAAVLEQVRWPAAAIADPPGLDATAACIRTLLD